MAYMPRHHYTHTQATLATVWTVDHQLGWRPAVHVEDAVGNVIYGSIQYVDDMTLTITFTNAITGSAYCS